MAPPIMRAIQGTPSAAPTPHRINPTGQMITVAIMSHSRSSGSLTPPFLRASHKENLSPIYPLHIPLQYQYRDTRSKTRYPRETNTDEWSQIAQAHHRGAEVVWWRGKELRCRGVQHIVPHKTGSICEPRPEHSWEAKKDDRSDTHAK